MKTIKYWFNDYECFEFNIDKQVLQDRIRLLLSDFDNKSLIDFILEYVELEDLFANFEEELKEYFEDEAYELWKTRR